MSGIKGRSGKKPDIKKDNKALKLRQKGLSFRDIGKVMEENVKNVFQRYHRALARNKNLSTR